MYIVKMNKTKPELKECRYCHCLFEPKYEGQVCCKGSCSAYYKNEQHRKACGLKNLHHAEL